jgi:hypothetical protein
MVLIHGREERIEYVTDSDSECDEFGGGISGAEELEIGSVTCMSVVPT